MSKNNAKAIKQSDKVKGIKITISNDQKEITRELVELDDDKMTIIMPRYNCITFKKRLYWFANILYRYWK